MIGTVQQRADPSSATTPQSLVTLARNFVIGWSAPSSTASTSPVMASRPDQ